MTPSLFLGFNQLSPGQEEEEEEKEEEEEGTCAVLWCRGKRILLNSGMRGVCVHVVRAAGGGEMYLT